MSKGAVDLAQSIRWPPVTASWRSVVIAVYIVEAGVKMCKVAYLSQHLVKRADRYDGLISQITEKYSSYYRVCDSVAKRQKFHRNLGVCHATIIGMHNLFV